VLVSTSVRLDNTLNDREMAQITLVRMNFSHGEYEYHQSVIDNTRKMVAGVHH